MAESFYLSTGYPKPGAILYTSFILLNEDPTDYE